MVCINDLVDDHDQSDAFLFFSFLFLTWRTLKNICWKIKNSIVKVISFWLNEVITESKDQMHLETFLLKIKLSVQLLLRNIIVNIEKTSVFYVWSILLKQVRNKCVTIRLKETQWITIVVFVLDNTVRYFRSSMSRSSGRWKTWQTFYVWSSRIRKRQHVG